MNYYEHHIGDYAAATAHLSWDEDMAYTRLLRAYYHAERGIPEGQQYRLARASTPAQRKAVDSVLAEFFCCVDGEYQQKRAQDEIERFHAGEPERKAKKANEENRLKRHREERARLFKVLTDAGQHAAWNINMNDLRELVKRCESPLPATAPATPATATHTQSHTQSQLLKEKKPAASPWLTVPELVEDGLSDEVADAWLKHRRDKKAKLTALAWAGFKAEAQKAQWEIEAAVLKAIARNWTGFEAAWVANEKPNGQAAPSAYLREKQSQVNAWMGSAAHGGDVIDMEVPNAPPALR